MQYEILRDGAVMLDGKHVGTCVTGEDGCACVEFFESCAPPKGEHMFSMYFEASSPVMPNDIIPENVAGWQPIETAPKDGTEILAWCNGPVVVWWASDGSGWDNGEYAPGERPAPKFWIQIPSPPQ